MPQKLATALFILILPVSAHATCLPAEPTVVHLSGVVERITFPGPPNYENVGQGDVPETYFVLRPSHPVCAEISGQGQVSSSELQLFLRPEQYEYFKPKLGSMLILSGRLWPGISGHHHTALMFTPVITPQGR